MNYENINNVIYKIEKLQQRGFNISLNVETILSDFESINEDNNSGKHTLPSEYRFVKTLQTGVYKNLANVTESQITEFVSLSRAIEKIRLVLSQEYEKRKLISGRVQKFKKYMCDSSDQEINTGNTDISDVDIYDASV